MDPDQVLLPVPINTGPCPRIERRVVEETADYVVFYDSWGIKRRDYKGGESMSEFLSFPVKNRQDWVEFRQRYLDPDDPERLAGDWRQVVQELVGQGLADPARLLPRWRCLRRLPLADGGRGRTGGFPHRS